MKLHTPPLYNAVDKVWSGPEIDKRIFDVPLGETLLNALQKHGDKLIQINHDTDERITCAEMRLKSLKVAENLEKIGIQLGDHVSILARHRSEVAPLYLGVIAIGAVLNPLYIDLTSYELNQLYAVIKPKLIICEAELIDKITKSLETLAIKPIIYVFSNAKDKLRSVDEFFVGHDTEPSIFKLPHILDLTTTTAVIYSTSGSTGVPKVCCNTHIQMLSRLYGGISSSDGVLRLATIKAGSPMTPLEIFRSCFYRSPRIFTDQPMTADLVLNILEKHEVNSVLSLPHILTDLCKQMRNGGHNLTTLTTIESGTAALSESTITDLREMLQNVQICSTYGMSGVGVIAYANSKTKPGSVGYLLPDLSVKIIDDNGNSLGPGEIGEIHLKRSGQFLGYLNNEAATKTAISEDGWFLSGDLGYIDTDGELFLFDRKKVMFKYKANTILPSELEKYIRKEFDVLEICVVGIPVDDYIGQLPAAVVALPPKSIVTESDITKAIEDNFSERMHLRGGVYFVTALPLTKNDKMKRTEVQQIAIKLYGQTSCNH